MGYDVETISVDGGTTALGAAGPFTLVVDRPREAGGGGRGLQRGPAAEPRRRRLHLERPLPRGGEAGHRAVARSCRGSQRLRRRPPRHRRRSRSRSRSMVRRSRRRCASSSSMSTDRRAPRTRCGRGTAVTLAGVRLR